MLLVIDRNDFHLILSFLQEALNVIPGGSETFEIIGRMHAEKKIRTFLGEGPFRSL